MNDILDILFQSDLSFVQDEKSEEEYSKSLDNITQAESAVKAELSQSQWNLVNTYLETIQQLHPLEYQAQFERGFLTGGNLIIEMISQHIRNHEKGGIR